MGNGTNRRQRSGGHQISVAAGANAPTVAAGILIALEILSAKDINGAGDRLRWLVSTTRNAGKSVTATNMGWCRGTRVS